MEFLLSTTHPEQFLHHFLSFWESRLFKITTDEGRKRWDEVSSWMVLNLGETRSWGNQDMENGGRNRN